MRSQRKTCTGDERKLYVFLVTATVQAGDGRRACVRMNAEVCEPVEFLN